ncbi:FAD binding domain-containing protein [Ovoidimarina sediminis]|uniref:FAD binding domain-containing protein n=1 Tax=Ovoidimarina sediminis TaxID=3079856 RepID=UPI0029158716|nr:xanthine dehydrogenase family protein subunit M [Rhodophyticola sp. MJ-SS7]MDU8945254.1 xanthine dehydrogenase family protein subunit M [Rhodophyticola sp. MJ-SS7]
MQFLRAESVSDVARCLAESPNAYVLAGGTDLLVQMGTRRIAPEMVIDIKHLPGIGEITQTENGFRIGAAVPGAKLGEDGALTSEWPGVTEAAQLIGSTQIQGRATMAGNLCNASPAADCVPALIAAGAEVEIAGPDGTRMAAVADIPTGPGKTTLAEGEFVTAILLPKRQPASGDAYLRFIPRTEMDIAVASAGAWLQTDADGTVTAARVALGAVAPTAYLVDGAGDLLVGTTLDDDTLKKLEAHCAASASPIDDKRGTVAFRIEVAGVLARRAAKIAYERAREAK